MKMKRNHALQKKKKKNSMEFLEIFQACSQKNKIIIIIIIIIFFYLKKNSNLQITLISNMPMTLKS